MRLLSAVILILLLPPIASAAGDQSPPPAAGSGLYLVEFTTGPGWRAEVPPPEQTGFREHSANLQRLRTSGLLLFGARYGDKGVILLRLPDEAAVHAELAADPAIRAGVFNAAVHEFRPFYPGEVPATGN